MKFEYNNKGKVSSRNHYRYYKGNSYVNSTSYLYDENERLTDVITESHNDSEIKGTIMGVVCWNSEMNKYHIRFSNFDKHGNWTKSYYMTEKGKVFRSKRKIKYL